MAGSSPHRRRSAVLAALVIAGSLTAAAPASAVTISVGIQDDAVADDGACSLREAIVAANNDAPSGNAAGECAAGSGPDIIVVPGGVYRLTRGSPGNDSPLGGDLDVLADLTVDGAGPDATTIEGTVDRIFHIHGVIATIEGVTVTGGRTPDGLNSPGSTAGAGSGVSAAAGETAASGGGILNVGVLTVQNTHVTGNATGAGGDGGQATGGNGLAGAGAGGFANGGNGGSGGNGGGIFSSGALTVVDSVISANRTGAGGDAGTATGGTGGTGATNGQGGMGGGALAGGGGLGGNGGGIASSGPLTIRNTRFSANETGGGGPGAAATGGDGGLGNGTGAGGTGGFGNGGNGGSGGSGGGLFTSGSATVTDSTFEANRTGGSGTSAGGTGGDGGSGGNSSGHGGKGGNGFGGTTSRGGNGGGIASGGPLTLSGSTVVGNVTGGSQPGGSAKGGSGLNGSPTTGEGGDGGNARGGGGGDGGAGGGVYTADSGRIVNTTVTGNTAGAGAAGGAGTGGDGGSGTTGGDAGDVEAANGGRGHSGGITAETSVVIAVPVVHATITGNTGGQGAPAGTGSAGTPGTGAPQGAASTITLGNAGGSAAGGGLGSRTGQATSSLTLTNSIVAGNSPAGCGLVKDGGHNLTFPDTTCPGVNADPLLGPLADNGGLTQTQALGDASPAIDAVPTADAGCEAADQRGIARPFGPACDIGAFEVSRPDGAGPAGTQPPPGGGTPADGQAPAFLSASVNPSVFAVNRRGTRETPVAAQRRRVRRGTTFRYRLSEAARVVFTIQRAKPGRRVAGRCRKPTRTNRRRPRCTRYVRIGRFAQQAVAGANRKRFSGRIGTRRLRPGRHRALLVATDAAGNRSAPRRLGFRIVRTR